VAVYKRKNTWWYKFIFAGKLVRESAKTTRKTVTLEAERNRRLELEKALAGIPVEGRAGRLRSVNDLIRPYMEHCGINHQPQSVLFSKGRLAHVGRLFGTVILPDLTENTIRGYIKTRLDEDAGGRTINMELGELSRAIGKKWSVPWPKVRKLEEPKDVGKALSPEDKKRLIETASSKKRWKVAAAVIRVSLLTGMRSGEITGMTWGRVDFEDRVITVGRAKTSSGTGRQIPMNDELFAALSAHAQWFTGKFGATSPEHYLFPFGKPWPSDPSRPTTTLKTVWGSIRGSAGVQCRLHDLRHTAATEMAEAGVPECTMLALMGHMSRAMLERYSHIRMAAKREAVKALSASPIATPNKNEKSTKTDTLNHLTAIQ
jgi:integrase